MLCSRIGILCSRCMLRRLLSRLARHHQSTCGYQAQYQAQQEQPPSLHDNCCCLPQPELEKHTHTKQFLHQPKFQPPRETQNHPLLFTKHKISHFKVVYSTDVLKSLLTTTRKEHTLIKLQPKTRPKKTGLGSLV